MYFYIFLFEILKTIFNNWNGKLNKHECKICDSYLWHLVLLKDKEPVFPSLSSDFPIDVKISWMLEKTGEEERGPRESKDNYKGVRRRKGSCFHPHLVLPPLRNSEFLRSKESSLMLSSFGFWPRKKENTWCMKENKIRCVRYS